MLTYISRLLAVYDNCPDDPNGGGTCLTNLPKVQGDSAALQHGLQLVFGIAGAMAMLFIVYSGFKYVKSQGEPAELEKARNAIIYALVGLTLAVSAEAIITFVLLRLR
jgi:hypothetical protein